MTNAYVFVENKKNPIGFRRAWVKFKWEFLLVKLKLKSRRDAYDNIFRFLRKRGYTDNEAVVVWDHEPTKEEILSWTYEEYENLRKLEPLREKGETW